MIEPVVAVVLRERAADGRDDPRARAQIRKSSAPATSRAIHGVWPRERSQP